MAVKNQNRQVSSNGKKSRFAAFAALIRRFRLKKLAAGGLLVSALFLVGDLAPMNSCRIFAESPHNITTNDTTGYDGAQGSNSTFLNVSDGVTLSGTASSSGGNTVYYQNLDKLTALGSLTLKGEEVSKNIGYGVIQNVDKVYVEKDLTLDKYSYIGYVTDNYNSTAPTLTGSGYSVNSVYVGGDLTLNGGSTTKPKSIISAGSVVVDGLNVNLGENTEIITSGAFSANTLNSATSETATITLGNQSKLNVGGPLTFRNIVNNGGTVNAMGYTSGERITINGGNVNFYGNANITGKDSFGIKNDNNLNAYENLRVAMSLENNFKANLYGETVIEGALVNNGKYVTEYGTGKLVWVDAELVTYGNVAVNLKPNYKNLIDNSGNWNSEGNITSEASLDNSGTLKTTGSISFKEKFNSDSLTAYEDGTGIAGEKLKGWVKVTVDNSGTLDVGGAFSSATGFTNSGTASIGSNMNMTGALINTNDLTTGGNVNLTNQGERTVAYMGTKDVGRNTSLRSVSYYWGVDEYLVGNIENSGTWNANGSISTQGSVNNSGTLNVTGDLSATQDPTEYTVKNYQNTTGQGHLQESGTVTGVFDSQITNSKNLNVSGSVTADGGFENSGTASIGGALNVTGALNNAKDATLTTDGKVTVADGGTRNVLSSTKKNVTFTTKEAYQETVGGEVKYKDKVENLTVDEWTVTTKDLTGKIENLGTWYANGGIDSDIAVTNGGALALGNDTSIKSYTQSGNTASTQTKGNFVVSGKDSDTALKLSDGTFVADGAVKVESNGFENAANAGFRSTLDVTGGLTNKEAGTLTTVGMVTADTITNSGKWEADGSVKTTGTLTNIGALTAAGNISADTLANNAGAKLSADYVSVTNAVTNAGTMDVDNIQADSLDNQTGSSLTVQNVKTTNGITNAGQMSVAGNLEGASLDNNSGELTTNNIKVAGKLTNAATLTAVGDVSADDDITNSSAMTVGGNITGKKALINNDGGKILAGNVYVEGDVTNNDTLKAGNIQGASVNNSKTLTAQNLKATNAVTNTGTMTVAGNLEGASLDNNSGELTTNNIKVAGKLTNAATLTAVGDVSADDDITNSSAMTVGGNVVGKKALINNEGGTILAGNVYVDGAIVNNDGLMADDIHGASLSNSKTLAAQNIKATDTITNTGTMTVAGLVEGASLDNNGDLTAQKVDITGAIDNSNGTIIVNDLDAGSLTSKNLTASGNVTVDGKVSNTENMEVKGTLLADEFENDGTAMVASHLFANKGLTNKEGKTLITAGNATTLGEMTNAGNWITFGKLDGQTLNNTGSIDLNSDMEIASDAVNDGTIQGTSANASMKIGGNLTSATKGTISALSALAVNGNISNQDITMSTPISTVEAGSLASTSVKNVGSVKVNGAAQLGTSDVLEGSGANAVAAITGDLTNEGSVSNFQNVSVSGTLSNDGVLTGLGAGSVLSAGTLDNKAGRTIDGFQSITVDGNATNAGTLTGMDEVIVNNGDFTNENGALDLAIRQDKITQISVNDGNATINGGTADVSGTDNMKAGQKYIFLSANDGTLTVNEELTFNTPKKKLFSAKGYYNDTQYWLMMARDQEYGDLPGLTGNQRNFGKYLDHISYTLLGDDIYNNSDLYTVLSALDNSRECGGDTANDLEQLSGSAYADQGLMGMQNAWFTHQNVANFLRPSDCSLDQEGLSNTVWGGFVGNTGNIKSDGVGLAHTYDSAGFLVGSDVLRSGGLRGGAYFQFQNVGISERGIRANSEGDHYDLGLYGLYEGDFGYLMASGDLSYGNYKTTRYISVGGNESSINRVHNGNRNSFQQSARVEIAPKYDLGIGGVLHPFTGITYVHMTLEDLVENGADKYVTAIQSRGEHLNSLRPEVGARWSACFSTERFLLGLNTRSSWVHEFCDTSATIENRFTNVDYKSFGDTGASYSIESTDLGRDYAWLGIGLSADTMSGWTVFGGYDVLTNSHATVHTGNMGTAFRW